MPPCERVREESRCSAELQTRLDILPQLQKELNKKDGELNKKEDELNAARDHAQKLQGDYERNLKEAQERIRALEEATAKNEEKKESGEVETLKEGSEERENTM